MALAISALVATLVTVAPVSADPIADKRSEAAGISAKLAALESQQLDLNAIYERANYDLYLAEQKIADARRLVAETSAEVERRREELRHYAVKAYTAGSDNPSFDALITSDSADGVRKQAYLESASGNRQDLIDSLNSTIASTEADASRLARAESEARASAKKIESAKAEAQKATSEERALNARVQGDLATLVQEENVRRVAAATTVSQHQGLAESSAPLASPATPARAGLGGAIQAALSKVGSDYVWAASGPNAFDCSGLVLWAYQYVGVSLPHYSGAQYASTTRISKSQLQSGDLVFWGAGGSEHVAIYMGGNQLVHAFSVTTGVAVTQLQGWWKTPSGYGRINA